MPEGIYVMAIGLLYLANSIYKYCKTKQKPYYFEVIFDFLVICGGALVTIGVIG